MLLKQSATVSESDPTFMMRMATWMGAADLKATGYIGKLFNGFKERRCFAASREPRSKVQEDPRTSSGRIRKPFGNPSRVE
jgi:hypothetical protein